MALNHHRRRQPARRVNRGIEPVAPGGLAGRSQRLKELLGEMLIRG
jgi:hypothetical protein